MLKRKIGAIFLLIVAVFLWQQLHVARENAQAEASASEREKLERMIAREQRQAETDLDLERGTLEIQKSTWIEDQRVNERNFRAVMNSLKVRHECDHVEYFEFGKGHNITYRLQIEKDMNEARWCVYAPSSFNLLHFLYGEGSEKV